MTSHASSTKRVPIQIWVDPELKAEFRRLAEREGRTVSSALRVHMTRTIEYAKSNGGSVERA